MNLYSPTSIDRGTTLELERLERALNPDNKGEIEKLAKSLGLAFLQPQNPDRQVVLALAELDIKYGLEKVAKLRGLEPEELMQRYSIAIKAFINLLQSWGMSYCIGVLEFPTQPISSINTPIPLIEGMRRKGLLQNLSSRHCPLAALWTPGSPPPTVMPGEISLNCTSINTRILQVLDLNDHRQNVLGFYQIQIKNGVWINDLISTISYRTLMRDILKIGRPGNIPDNIAVTFLNISEILSQVRINNLNLLAEFLSKVNKNASEIPFYTVTYLDRGGILRTGVVNLVLDPYTKQPLHFELCVETCSSLEEFEKAKKYYKELGYDIKEEIEQNQRLQRPDNSSESYRQRHYKHQPPPQQQKEERIQIIVKFNKEEFLGILKNAQEGYLEFNNVNNEGKNKVRRGLIFPLGTPSFKGGLEYAVLLLISLREGIVLFDDGFWTPQLQNLMIELTKKAEDIGHAITSSIGCNFVAPFPYIMTDHY